MKLNITNKTIISIYSVIFKKFLKDWHTGKQSKIIKIVGWRTMLINKPWGSRETITPLFKLLDYKDYPNIWKY